MQTEATYTEHTVHTLATTELISCSIHGQNTAPASRVASPWAEVTARASCKLLTQFYTIRPRGMLILCEITVLRVGPSRLPFFMKICMHYKVRCNKCTLVNLTVLKWTDKLLDLA